MSDGCLGGFSLPVSVLAGANVSPAGDDADGIMKGLVVKQVCASAL